MRFNSNNMRVPNMFLNTTLKKFKIPLVMGMLLVSVNLLGTRGFGLASMDNGSLQIHQERVAGSVTQLPLGVILDQLQAQLGIEYQAPKEALDQPVSVDLHGESLPQALAKILAQWDYALTIDPAGKVQEIFVLKKDLTKRPEAMALHTEADQSHFSNYSGVDKGTQTFMREPQGLPMDDSPEEFPTVDTSHPVFPSKPSPQERRQLQEALDEAGMGALPPPDSYEMNVNQISEEEKQAILQSLNPSPMGSLEEAGFQEMPIAPVSEEEANEILRSLNQSIGRGGGPSPP